MSNIYQKEPNCIYNPEVECQWGKQSPSQRAKCEKCGWNLKVSRRRAEKVREELEETTNKEKAP